MSRSQNFLFLQGVCSPFFPELAKALKSAGHSVWKVNFSAGDRIYWRQGNAISYSGAMSKLPEFYGRIFDTHRITDIVLFGDCRPVHRPAIHLANAAGIKVHVFEEGYFRPYWVTLEQGGVNGHSSLSKDPAYYTNRAKQVPDYGNGESFVSPFWKRAIYDVGYNFWAGLNPILHRGVQRHVPYSPAMEYVCYLRKGLGSRSARRRAQAMENILVAGDAPPFFLFPLQLATDSQITNHSPYDDMLQAVEHVIASFAEHAPSECKLVIKVHPLDPGLLNYAYHVKRLAAARGVSLRIIYIDGGNLPALLTASRGIVTINSTVGGSALIHGRPTKVLGNAIYDLPGLTHQGTLNDYWNSPSAPDIALFRSFRNVVIHDTQINGGFYCTDGIRMSVRNSLQRLTTS